MKILVFSQYYYPEPFKIHEICERLVQNKMKLLSLLEDLIILMEI